VALFEAFYNYCFVPKHTIGAQLLTVRRAKRERAAYVASHAGEVECDEESRNEVPRDCNQPASIRPKKSNGNAIQPGGKENHLRARVLANTPFHSRAVRCIRNPFSPEKALEIMNARSSVADKRKVQFQRSRRAND
jgi:hypothetical protein